MTLEQRRAELIEWLNTISDKSILNQVSQIKQASTYEMSVEELRSIEKGLEQAKRGELRPASEARAIYKKWLPK